MAILRVATAAILSLVLLIVCLPTVYTSPVFTRDRQHPGEASGEIEAGKLGAVASESALCSRYGTNMLEKGGNAADAVNTLILSVDPNQGTDRLCSWLQHRFASEQ